MAKYSLGTEIDLGLEDLDELKKIKHTIRVRISY